MTHSTDPVSCGIAIVATSGYAPDEQAVARAIARFESSGCRVWNYYDPSGKHERFGGDDAARVAQLHAAARNPEVDVIVALRGGYGLSRLLGDIDLQLLAESGKRIVGHSDITALQMALLARQGAASFAGPMICDDFGREDPSEFTLGEFWSCLASDTHDVRFDAGDSPDLDLSGILWGGNLAMLCHLAGTPYLPRIDGGILFLEDINEHPYRVERMLLQLFHAGLLDQKAIVLGDFSGYRLSPYDNGYDFDRMLAYLREAIDVPIVRGLPFGHIRDKTTLAVGSHARLRCSGGEAVLSMSGYPALDKMGTRLLGESA
ncbi:muramoyltetrapeptide carboxypeptidase [Noviherbaspirillum galbum]|uniref:Muramoyltetrapeptide carboxypeptidase n=1 Tax=Noviherbaspirillum galbum TaxID=2709383 RepID=A0A6B3SGF3_9BURK|nr:muramoyltetrapeptide carboxypeptidase [Noviherbaspirillum galbum]NEX59738.1 muramoyltetrapeptide carboxypeptidase [Noviherbaspirillum galbum]